MNDGLDLVRDEERQKKKKKRRRRQKSRRCISGGEAAWAVDPANQRPQMAVLTSYDTPRRGSSSPALSKDTRSKDGKMADRIRWISERIEGAYVSVQKEIQRRPASASSRRELEIRYREEIAKTRTRRERDENETRAIRLHAEHSKREKK
ncbi:hypothetical protein TEQG_01618 [Trichophyton equinum CBS 127.97]|uniref:Uncharacterized protein n=1 Tax=Trichophyton equinum (strain ATCC MYA-4606 / CBS 127.97) TaxID=559882 RepID=F2PKY5_TRIEC|nr:hypothetical protein TEQG_01618 [Trichophyton equinum CBS 127.97]